MFSTVFDNTDKPKKSNLGAKIFASKSCHFQAVSGPENINDVDYAHAKSVYKDFETKRLGEYYDLYVQSHTIMLADVFENFGKMP